MDAETKELLLGRKKHAPRTQWRDLERDVDRLQVAVLALADLLARRGGATPQELAEAMLRADLQSGQLDGAAFTQESPFGFVCGACGQPSASELAACPFCGSPETPVRKAEEEALHREPPPPSGVRVRIFDDGDSSFLVMEQVDRALVDHENARLKALGKRPARYEVL